MNGDDDDLDELLQGALHKVRRSTPKYLLGFGQEEPEDWSRLSKALDKLSHKSREQGVDPQMELRASLFRAVKALRNLHEHGGGLDGVLKWATVLNAALVLRVLGYVDVAAELQRGLLVSMPEMPSFSDNAVSARILRLSCGAASAVHLEHQQEGKDRAAFAELLRSFGHRSVAPAKLCIDISASYPRYVDVELRRASETQVTWSGATARGSRTHRVRVAMMLTPGAVGAS